VWCVAFSPDGSRVVSGSKDQTVRFWDPQSGKSIGPPFQSQTAEVRSVAFSPDMTYLICVSMDDTVECWDLRSGAPMELGLEGNTKELLSITISPNGSRIAAVSLSGIVYLWDVVNCRLVSPPIESLVDGFKSLTFTPDGTQLILACIDGSTFLWNAVDGKPILTSSSSDFFLSAKLGVGSFDVKQGWRLGEFNDSLLRWLPSNDPNYGVWAYIGGKVIRINGGDSVTIIDVNTNGESEATGVRL
jgi:WD40 repeat protein